MTTPRPDVMHVVGLVARFQSSPNETHVQAFKMIFRYLKGTMDFGLWYPTRRDFMLIDYIDTDWIRSVDDIKSNSDGTIFLGSCLVSWLRKK